MAVRMNNRKKFVDYVKNGGEKFCSPQIGAGAGFDTKLAGKEWVSETTPEDTIAATQQFDMVPLFNFGLPDAGFCDETLSAKQVKSEWREGNKWQRYELETPKGTVSNETLEEKKSGITPVKFKVSEKEDLDVLEWFLDASLETDLKPLENYVSELSGEIGSSGALSMQWGAQPYELLSWSNTMDTVFLANDYPEKFKALMDKILKLDLRLMDCCKKGGADFIFLGGPGAEMISPSYYEDYLVPYSEIVSAEAHARGLLVYTHICSPIEPMLTKGYYNRMGIDLFETLSAPPVGNIKSLTDALSKLDERICTRGNIGLDVLLNGTQEQVEESCYAILEQTRGRKHILAASDYLFYDIPKENVAAMCKSIQL